MDKRGTVFDLTGQIFAVFGFTVICLIVFTHFFGDKAVGYSSIFALGKEGIALSTLLQFLLTSTIIVILRQLFCTDIFIKNMSITRRTICLYVSVIAVIVVFVGLFKWFPINELKPWIFFVICFGVSSIGGFTVSVLKEKAENKRMQDALEKFKEGNE